MLWIHVASFVGSASAITFAHSVGSALSAASRPNNHHQRSLPPFEHQLLDSDIAENDAHWPSLGASKFFERSIEAAIMAAKMDPCNAEVLSTGLGRPCGLGGRADIAANELQLAAYFNKSVAFCDGFVDLEGINYAGFFESSIGICHDVEVCSKRESKVWKVGSSMTLQIKMVDYDSAFNMKTASYQALFGTLNAETRVLVDDRHQQAGLPGYSEYVGVHIRRGDKANELKKWGLRFNTTEEYAGVVQTQLAARGLDTVYLASDDAAAHAELLAALRPSTPNVNVIQCFTPTSASRSYVDAQGTLAFLADMVALRDAAVFIGTQSSAASRLVNFLRTETASSITIDGDWLDNNLI